MGWGVVTHSVYIYIYMYIYQFSSVAQLCPTLCDPMDCSTPGFPIYHQLLEPTQTHVHHVSDAIQPSQNAPFSCLQSSPASESFPVSWLFASGGQSNWSFSFSISPSSEYSGLNMLYLWICCTSPISSQLKATSSFVESKQFVNQDLQVIKVWYKHAFWRLAFHQESLVVLRTREIQVVILMSFQCLHQPGPWPLCDYL